MRAREAKLLGGFLAVQAKALEDFVSIHHLGQLERGFRAEVGQLLEALLGGRGRLEQGGELGLILLELRVAANHRVLQKAEGATDGLDALGDQAARRERQRVAKKAADARAATLGVLLNVVEALLGLVDTFVVLVRLEAQAGEQLADEHHLSPSFGRNRAGNIGGAGQQPGRCGGLGGVSSARSQAVEEGRVRGKASEEGSEPTPGKLLEHRQQVEAVLP